MRGDLRRLYRKLLGRYGPQEWWPARSAFEMSVGAILTQNTAWLNVERAVASLRRAGYLSAERMSRARAATLAGLVRPAGYFNQKAARLRAWSGFLVDEWGSLARAKRRRVGDLRAELLALKGIGPETADSILCYALGKPVFVVDAYTRRILSRLGWVSGDEPYDDLRAWCESRLPAEAGHLGEMHALLVRHAKEHCRKRPVCDGCVAARSCDYARAAVSEGG